MDAVISVFSGLVGFPAVLAAVINLLKQFNVLPDGSAPAVNFWANLVAFVAVAAAVFFGKLELVSQIDANLSQGVQLLLAIAAFASSIGLTKLFNFGLRGVPYIGFSHTIEARKAE